MKTALITGGSRGIGAAAVRAFAKAGYRVAFFYHQSQEAAKALARETSAMAIGCDVRDPAQVAKACGEALGQLQHVDALLHSAGIAKQQLFTDVTREDWRDMFAVHVDGAFYVLQSLLPSMISRKSGRIVLVSSMWGQVGASMEVPYSAAKAALIGLTRALAKEVGPSGIGVNCLAPGAVETDMLAGLSPETLTALAQETPLLRLGTAQEAAQAILWLCSEESAFVTGQVLSVNGGLVVG